MKKTNIFKSSKNALRALTLILLTSIALTSCSQESIDDEASNAEFNDTTIQQKIDLDNWNGGGQGDNGNVFVALVTDDSCGNGKFVYTIYASATQTKPYDREVQAGVVKNGNFIEAKVLIIPANQHVSSNAPAFVGASQEYDSAISKAFNVLASGTIESGYSFPSISYDLDNCFSSIGSCYIGFSAPDNPDTVANEGAGDQDNDGICNSTDPDDNNNLIPDAWED